MKLSDINPIIDQLKQVQGVEGELLRRKRKGTISAIVALAVAILQILIAAIEKDYLKDIGKFFNSLIHFRWGELIGPDGLSIYELTGMLILVIALGTYFLFRWTSFLLKESEEPFRYTFWIKPFKRVKDTPDARFTLKEGDRFHLLHHDLMERLNERIRRLSLLDVDSLNLPSAAQEALTSHIHIEGHYAIREEKNDDWVIHVMPRIRIGPPSRPAILANPVKYPLSGKTSKTKDILTQVITPQEDVFEDVLDADRYNQIVERVYSSIATEVYRQIESDVKGKIRLFPTPYLRAVALFHEAEDFARSNTVDAYDRAIELYGGAMRYFNISNIKWITELLIKCPILWRLKIKFKHMQARVKIGYAKCLIYRRYISALTGRYRNPLFEILGELEEVIDSLKGLHKKVARFKENSRLYHLKAFLTFPKDSLLRYLFLRPSQSLFERQRRILFDAYVVNALAHSFLGAVEKANESLGDAKDVDPQQSERNALYLLTAGEIEPDVDEEILLFRQATERAPDFQIAQFFLAYYSEMRFRAQNEIEKARAGSVLEEYDEVLKINPGNTGALASQGYLSWLLKDFAEAKKKFEEGCEIKATFRETFIGELNYGRARIAAEEGKFNKSHDLYTEAISADPGVGAYSATANSRVNASYYDYMVLDILKRYEIFKTKVKEHIKKIEELPKGTKKCDAENKEVSEKTLNSVHSFVLNDYGNACLKYFHRFGDRKQLEEAINAFEKAAMTYPANAVVYYNLHNAYEWYGEPSEKIFDCLEKAKKLATAWPVMLIASAQSQVRRTQELITKKKQEIEDENEKLERAKGQLEKKREQARAQERVAGEFRKVKNAQAKVTKGPLEVKDAQARVQGHEVKVEELKAEIKTLDNLWNNVFQRIMEQTKLFSLFEGLKIDYNGKGVNELCTMRIEKDKLDENDIDALRVLAEGLSYNENNKALKASVKLCHLIQQYYPENFDTDLILYRIYEKLAKFSWDNVPGKDSERLLILLKDDFDIRWAETAEIYKSDDGRIISISNDENSAKLTIDEKEEKATLKINNGRTCHLIVKTENGKLNIYSNKYNQMKEACKKRIRAALIYWLTYDQIHYISLKWTENYFSADERIKFLEKAIKLESKNAAYHDLLGDSYKDKAYFYKKEEWEKAVQVWEKAAYEYRKAAYEYRKASQIEPGNQEYLDNKLNSVFVYEGDAYYDREIYLEAIKKYKKALEVQPGDTTTQSKLDRAEIALHFGKKITERFPVVAPIAVEVAGNLIPYVESATGTEGLHPTLSDLIVNMREDISKTNGVKVPSIRFRDNEDLPEGTYNILINEIPLAKGTISEEKRLFPGPMENLTSLGVFGEEMENPLTEDEAVWILRKDWEKVERAGHSLWEVIEYMVRDLEAVIRRNLSEFLGHQEVMNMLVVQLYDLHKQMQDTPADLTALTAVIKGLLNEGVPIIEFEKIVTKFNQLKKDKKDLLTNIETVRSIPEVQKTLLGNNDQYSFYPLGRRFEEEIKQSISIEDYQPVLTMEPKNVQYALTAVREQVGSNRKVALLVENAELRPFVRQLIEIEFSLVPVLSRRELLPGLEGKIIEEIELEQQDGDLNNNYKRYQKGEEI